MSDFKFNCPSCGQHILANSEWRGRFLNCPSCEARITIPAAPQKSKKETAKALPAPAAKPKPSAEAPRVEVPTKPGKPGVSRPAAPAGAPRKPAVAAILPAEKAAKPGAAPRAEGQLRVAVLTAAIKLEMVRAVRRRIAQESAWLPGKIAGEYAYAAKLSGSKNVPVEIDDPAATRFSMIGAFRLELRERQVVRTAAGRARFLDSELPETVREVLREELSAEEREVTKDPLAGKDWVEISHAQCLAVLDRLEENYAQAVEQVQIEKAQRKLENVRLPDLVKKLEKKGRVTPEQVATALYHELMDLRRRLDRLEGRVAAGK